MSLLWCQWWRLYWSLWATHGGKSYKSQHIYVMWLLMKKCLQEVTEHTSETILFSKWLTGLMRMVWPNLRPNIADEAAISRTCWWKKYLLTLSCNVDMMVHVSVPPDVSTEKWLNIFIPVFQTLNFQRPKAPFTYVRKGNWEKALHSMCGQDIRQLVGSENYTQK